MRFDSRLFMIVILSTLVLSAASRSAFAGDSSGGTLTLNECFRLAKKNHPLMAKRGLIEESSSLAERNLTFRWLPSFTLEGRASYQSDVTEIDAELPAMMTAYGFEFPSSAKDQYRAELKVDQMLFDSGITSARKEMVRRELAISLMQVEADFHSVKRRINETYFAVLLLQKQAGIAETITRDLEEQSRRIASGVKHGVIKPSDLQELESKILENEQRIISIESDIAALYDVLGELIGEKVEESTSLAVPSVELYQAGKGEGITRPELESLELERKRLDTAGKLTFRGNLPKLHGFAVMGYGRPGLNMLSDQYDSYYTVGAYLSWNFFDWGINRRERRIYDINEKVLKRSEEALLKNIRADIIRAEESIARYEKIVVKDRGIVELREKIAEEKKARLESGALTTADYISEVNRLERARINMEKNRIELSKARVDYLMVKGEL